ncbi:transposase, partial [Pantoea sp. SIMBA_079]|uniref:transposase n=1 Tax=Pantoea sp. SIMBA_079 TaxID=3085817 RepID=UPI00399234CE
NMLRKINELIDFSFVLEELRDNYCFHNGRNAVDPIRMFKYFLGMAPEDPVIDPSSLTKFRKLRLKDINLLDMLIHKTVEIAIEKEIIKNKTIIVDATHTKARYN